MSYIELLDLNTYLRCQGNKLIETGGDAISQIQTVGISTGQTTYRLWGGGEQKGNLNNLCQQSVPYLILLPTEEGKKDNCEHWLDTNDIKVNIYA